MADDAGAADDDTTTTLRCQYKSGRCAGTLMVDVDGDVEQSIHHT